MSFQDSILAVKALLGSAPLYDLISKYIGISMMDLWAIWTLIKTKISAIPDDRGVGGMTVSPDFQVVKRRRQNDKAC
ncbi:hypothetical protein H8356DRAFT_1431784 [Neocallimastix lanati (nom. inval.)]|nr:hypothetical protein H8356DRAFT_1431784 [Neocallimastix sp. JGI-2020a]